MLRHRAWEYQPDVVLLVFFTGNDIRNNSRALEQDELRPYFVYDGNQLIVDNSFRDTPSFRQKQTRFNNMLYNAINHFRLLQLLNAIRERAGLTRKQAPHAAQSPESANPMMEMGADDLSLVPPRDRNWEEAWRVTEGLIALMNQEVQGRGARFFLVSAAASNQVHPDPSVRRAYMQKLGVSDLFYPGERLSRLGNRDHFRVLDLAPPFQVYAEKHNRSLHGFGAQSLGGHWNAEGHQLASELISSKLCEWLGE